MGWLLADKIVRIVLGLCVGAWVARYLGPSQFGHLAYALALAAFFQTFASLGLDGIAVREIVRDASRAAEVLGTTLWLRVASGAIAWVGAAIAIALLRPGDEQDFLLVILVTGGVLFQAADTVDLWFQSQLQSRRTVVAKLAATVATNGVKIALILGQAPLLAFAAMQLLEFALAALALVYAYRQFPTTGRWDFALHTGTAMFREAWPLLLSGLSVAVYMRINQLLLRELAGDQELGLYSAVLPFAEVWNFIPIMVCASVAPAIARKKLEGEPAYYATLQSLFSALAWMALVLSLGVAVLAKVIVILFLGSKYLSAVPALRVLAFTSVPVFLGVAQNLWIVNDSKASIWLAKTFIGATVSVIMSVLLIPRLGALGGAVSCVVAYLASAVISNAFLAPRIFAMQLGAYRFSNVFRA